ncbi:hypothetical protein TorRG33x02_347100, partial [Trema orientale]
MASGCIPYFEIVIGCGGALMRELVAVEADAADPDLGDEINDGEGGDGDEWRYEIAQYAVVIGDTNGLDFIILPS